jgi:hypothetical protein
MKYITVVLKYTEDQSGPSFSANMEVLGGKVLGVMFDDALLRIEELEKEIEIIKAEK